MAIIEKFYKVFDTLQESGEFPILTDIDLSLATSYAEVYRNVFQIMCIFDTQDKHGPGEAIHAMNRVGSK